MADSLFDVNDDHDANIDYLKELTKPGGKFDRSKYKDDTEMYQAIAKGKYHGDKTLEAKLEQFDQLREDFLQMKATSTAQAKLDELVTRLESRRNEPDTTNNGINEQPQIDLTKLEELATQKALAAIQQHELSKKESENLAVVESRLRERFGDSAKQVLRDRMNTLGLTADDLKVLAKKSPDVAINALGITQVQQGYQNPPMSNIRSDSFKPNVDIRDAVYYEKLRRENPKDYYSDKISVQRLKDMDHPDFMKRYDEQNPRTY